MNGNLDYQDSEPSSIHDAVVSSVASHSPGPDVESAVSQGVEEHRRNIKYRDRSDKLDSKEYEGVRSERLRSGIRAALNEEKQKAARGPAPAKADVTVKPGAPATWDLKAKGGWDALPLETRLAVQRQEANVAKMAGDIQPHMQAYAEIDKVLAPSRQIYQQHGLNDAQAVGKLFEWEGRFRNPETRMQAFHDLARQYGMQLPGAQQHDQQSDPQAMAAVESELSQFSKGRPHFEKVRHGMGLLIASHGEKYMTRDGKADLARAYDDACRNLGIGQTAPRRASSPSSRAPAGGQSVSDRGGGSVRDSLLSAFRQGR